MYSDPMHKKVFMGDMQKATWKPFLHSCIEKKILIIAYAFFLLFTDLFLFVQLCHVLVVHVGPSVFVAAGSILARAHRL